MWGVKQDCQPYDTVAGEYARRIYSELQDKPFDRDLLDRFGERVRALGPVCDLGCGPGQIARYLRDRGLDVFGLDLSHGMLIEARRLNPDIGFVRGDMLALVVKSGTLGGIAAFYSVIHMERERVTVALAEMGQVLRLGGGLLLAFHLGTGEVQHTDFLGQGVEIRATLFTSGEMIGYLEAAGFTVEEALEREPYPEVEYQSRRGYVLAGKTGRR